MEFVPFMIKAKMKVSRGTPKALSNPVPYFLYCYTNAAIKMGWVFAIK